MKKILLVEDDRNLREIYGIRLTAEGYTILSAGDGEEALAAAVKEKPDLILSDVMMPKISGFDMLDILRVTPETKSIKVIIMTALSAEEQRARGEKLGADRFLVKSQVGIEDVVNAVKEVLGDKQEEVPEMTIPDMSQGQVEPAAAIEGQAAVKPNYYNVIKNSNSKMKSGVVGAMVEIIKTEQQKTAPINPPGVVGNIETTENAGATEDLVAAEDTIATEFAETQLPMEEKVISTEEASASTADAVAPESEVADEADLLEKFKNKEGANMDTEDPIKNEAEKDSDADDSESTGATNVFARDDEDEDELAIPQAQLNNTPEEAAHLRSVLDAAIEELSKENAEETEIVSSEKSKEKSAKKGESVKEEMKQKTTMKEESTKEEPKQNGSKQEEPKLAPENEKTTDGQENQAQ